MIHNNKIVVVMPAYNAGKTLKKTYDEIPHDIVDAVILVDDGSKDNTVSLATMMGIPTYSHYSNYGYGRNQKTCYNEALKLNADIVVMLHPDYQYSPRLITAMASMIASNDYDVVIASRILGVGALSGGMPLYKYLANRILTFIQNSFLSYKLSEYHTGYRAFSRKVLERLPLMENSDDFVFDNQMLAQIIYFNFRIGEISCPTKYFEEASSINFSRSVKYGFGVLWVSICSLLNRLKICRSRIFDLKNKKLPIVDKPESYYAAIGKHDVRPFEK